MPDRRTVVNVEHATITAKVEALEEQIARHIHPEIEELAAELLGPRRPSIAGNVRDSSRGIRAAVLDIDERLRRMETRDTLSRADRLALYAAAAGVLVAVWQGFAS